MNLVARLQKVYPRVPVWMQNVGISLYGLAYRSERLGGVFEESCKQFRLRNRWSAEQMDKYVTGRLREQVLEAFEQVPYYRAKWQDCGVRRDDLACLTAEHLRYLPITKKDDLRLDGDQFLSVKDPKRSGLKRYHSSGSTGTPVTLVCTSKEHQQFLAAREVRSFEWAGTSIRSPRSMIGGRPILSNADAEPPYYRVNCAERQVYLSAYHIGPHTVKQYVDALNRFKPQVLTGYAYSHFILARLMLANDIRLAYEPRCLVLSSEKLTPEMKTTLAEAFGARAYEEYGAVENCFLATECEFGSLHVSPDFGVIEILDDNDEPCRPGVAGRLVCTGLINSTQPLIRYETGDVGLWSPGRACPCGREQFPILAEVVGRTEDVIYGIHGQQMVRFHGVFIDLPRIREAQLIQEELDCIRIRVVAPSGLLEEDITTMTGRVRKQLGPLRVTVEQVAAIERTQMGKFKAVVSKIAAPQRAELPRIHA